MRARNRQILLIRTRYRYCCVNVLTPHHPSPHPSPQIKESLTKQLKEWQKNEKEPLQVNGVNYLEKMQEVEGAYHGQKQQALAEKKAAKKASIGALGLTGSQNVTGNRRGSQAGAKGKTLKGGGGKAKPSAEAAPLGEVSASSRNSSD